MEGESAYFCGNMLHQLSHQKVTETNNFWEQAGGGRMRYTGTNAK